MSHNAYSLTLSLYTLSPLLSAITLPRLLCDQASPPFPTLHQSHSPYPVSISRHCFPSPLIIDMQALDRVQPGLDDHT
nr:hypothetical protein CFP56_50082 [Quercus suber]